MIKSNPGIRKADVINRRMFIIGAAKVVIFFGIAHHLMITHRIPILSILEILSNLTKEYIVFEFVDNLDPKFQHLAGKNINLYKNYTKDNFEKDLSCYFEIINVFCYENNKHRFVYILRKKIN